MLPRVSEDISDHLEVPKDAVYRWIKHQGLQTRKIGRFWKVKVSELDERVRAGGASPVFAEHSGGNR